MAKSATRVVESQNLQMDTFKQHSRKTEKVKALDRGSRAKMLKLKMWC